MRFFELVVLAAAAVTSTAPHVGASTSSFRASAPVPHRVSLQKCTFQNSLQQYTQMDGPLDPKTGWPLSVQYVSGAGAAGGCLCPVAFRKGAATAAIAIDSCSQPWSVWNVSVDRGTNGMLLTPAVPVNVFAGTCLQAPSEEGGFLSLAPCSPSPDTNETQLWGFNGNPAVQGIFPFSDMSACATIAPTEEEEEEE